MMASSFSFVGYTDVMWYIWDGSCCLLVLLTCLCQSSRTRHVALERDVQGYTRPLLLVAVDTLLPPPAEGPVGGLGRVEDCDLANASVGNASPPCATSVGLMNGL